MLIMQDKATVKPFVVCKDSSTYGTFVNDGIQSKTKLTRNSSTTLKTDNRVKFGLQWNIFKSDRENYMSPKIYKF